MQNKGQGYSGRVTLAITGASGAPYALKLMQQLVAANIQVLTLMSSAARVVFATEENLKIPAGADKASDWFCNHLSAKPDQIIVYSKEDWFSPVASGSSAPKKMIICPCSTGTLSAVANGACDNLIERAADVVIKEKAKTLLATFKE